MSALGRGAVCFGHPAGLYHRRRGAQPRLAGNCDHRRLIDNADGVPREQGITGLGTVDTGWNSDLERPREPGEGTVTAEADTMVLGIVFLEAEAEPSCLTVGGSPCRFELGRGNADLDRPFRNSAVESGRIGPVDREDLAVIEGLAVLMEAIGLHPLHDLMEIGAFKHMMLGGPGHRNLVCDEDFRLMAGFCKRLLGGDAIAVVEIAPR